MAFHEGYGYRTHIADRGHPGCQAAHISSVAQALSGQIAGHIDVVVHQDDLLNLRNWAQWIRCRIKMSKWCLNDVYMMSTWCLHDVRWNSLRVVSHETNHPSKWFWDSSGLSRVNIHHSQRSTQFLHRDEAGWATWSADHKSCAWYVYLRKWKENTHTLQSSASMPYIYNI